MSPGPDGRPLQSPRHPASHGAELRVRGDHACFTRPVMEVERVSRDAMTPAAHEAAARAARPPRSTGGRDGPLAPGQPIRAAPFAPFLTGDCRVARPVARATTPAPRSRDGPKAGPGNRATTCSRRIRCSQSPSATPS
ncbi:MAG: CRISPR-associated protein Cas5 [Boseongicola sp. SB0677_bin_26]|nr:CRISPR-associated protein Cas5 [Boseongicola sp. SB0665_bin_10]MYG27914.1 CRISPR-associated protein Cas5 [Boseongicola sp. SB0677_bin_26]